MNESRQIIADHGIILENRSRLCVSGVLDITGFDEDTVVMETSLGQLTVKGQGLKVVGFANETGCLTIEGNIAALCYTGNQSKRGTIKRLFG